MNGKFLTHTIFIDIAWLIMFSKNKWIQLANADAFAQKENRQRTWRSI